MATVLEYRMLKQKTLIAFLRRALAVLAVSALAACAGTDTSTAPLAAVNPNPRPIAAGRGQTPPPSPPPPPAEPASRPSLQQARAECWMRMETEKKAPKDPEKRLPLVEKCVQEKMSAPPPPVQAPQ